MYGSNEQKRNHEKRGNSNPISRKEAIKTESLIKTEKFNEAQATGNLVELKLLSERQADAKHMLQDDGSGGRADARNREYGVTTNKDGTRKEYTGEVSDPH